jgi:hypothetical protein
VAYLALNGDGSTTDLGTIKGYRVAYKRNGQSRLSKPFTFLWQALGFQKTLAMGASSKVVPIYEGEKHHAS